jgi:cytochrome c6
MRVGMASGHRIPFTADRGKTMKRLTALCIVLLALNAMTDAVRAAALPGAAAFEANCSECHPDGRNIVTPAKDLRVLTLRANGIMKAEDIVAKMRKPGPGMTRFDPKDLSDREALEIAEYILATFK